MRICIVDDDALVLDALVLLLQDRGHEVHIARASQDAAALIEEVRPECAVLDFEMPGAKGDALARQLRSAHPSLPLVLMSGHAKLGPGAIGPAGADVFLQKPFTPSRLMEMFQRAKGLRSALA